MTIEWRPIAEFPAYEVSNTGLVRGKAGVLTLRTDPKGYLFATLRQGKTHKRAVARLVAAAFIGPRPDGCVVRHRDGIKSNNVPANLSYGTPTENEQDKRGHGTAPIGQHHPAAKLTEGQVADIRRRFIAYHPVHGGAAMGREYGVSQNTVSKIVTGKLWPHLLPGRAEVPQ